MLRWSGFFSILPILFTLACATSPLGRKQLLLVPESQMDAMGVQAFQQIKASQPIDSDPALMSYIQCIVKPLTEAAKSQTSVRKWDVVIFKNDEANAFALPGGKIGVYSGILKVAKTDAQVATILAHEIGHVISKHGDERVSQQAGTELGLAALGVITASNPHRDALMSLLGLGTQVGITLPFSRTQETEADLVGLDLMARSGFDPRQSVELWKNMIAASRGNTPPQWLSDHPASENRILALQENMPEAKAKYDPVRAAGHSVHCDRSQLRQ